MRTVSGGVYLKLSASKLSSARRRSNESHPCPTSFTSVFISSLQFCLGLLFSKSPAWIVISPWSCYASPHFYGLKIHRNPTITNMVTGTQEFRAKITWAASDTVNEFTAGAVGGIAGLVIGHPLDTLKILMQNSTQKPSAIEIFKNIRQFGATNLFRGLTLPFYSYAITNAVTFGVYKTTLKELDPTGNSVFACLAAGAASGMAQLIPATPIELIKIQQQNTAISCGPNLKIKHCVQLIIQQRGLRGLYVGLSMHALRDIPGLTVYFFGYTTFLRYGCLIGLSPFWCSCVSGALGGALSWCVSLPFDIVKTRMQSGGLNTTRDVVRELVKESDYSVFFRGFNVAILRALMVNACTFTVYEMSYASLSKSSTGNRIC
ncbi:hypothetical protein T265_01211 [Opisthorchis viverrini]|uniref:Uncharacterized protein n=1 Tax=Opisthorchis viverrini TaxID=6198 RepID=A0A075A072_OPIVI|nr:hypothetical protein T265_01211 [Opisthorchis viverrini]KER32721.1 hypothetical protein T265_01211 [Opisthorchis viverrini]